MERMRRRYGLDSQGQRDMGSAPVSSLDEELESMKQTVDIRWGCRGVRLSRSAVGQATKGFGTARGSATWALRRCRASGGEHEADCGH